VTVWVIFRVLSPDYSLPHVSPIQKSRGSVVVTATDSTGFALHDVSRDNSFKSVTFRSPNISFNLLAVL